MALHQQAHLTTVGHAEGPDDTLDGSQGGWRAVDASAAAATAVQHLVDVTGDRSCLHPAEVDLILEHLVEALAALPQVCSQVGHVLGDTRAGPGLATGEDAGIFDPALLIDAALRYLGEASDQAVALRRLLQAAHDQVTLFEATPHPA